MPSFASRYNRLEIAEIDVERAERSHDDEIGENEGPAADPSSPKSAAQISDVDTDLDRQRSRHRLADRNRFTHLLLAKPAALGDDLALHLADQRHGTAESQQAQPEKIAEQLRPSSVCYHRISSRSQ